MYVRRMDADVRAYLYDAGGRLNERNGYRVTVCNRIPIITATCRFGTRNRVITNEIRDDEKIVRLDRIYAYIYSCVYRKIESGWIPRRVRHEKKNLWYNSHLARVRSYGTDSGAIGLILLRRRAIRRGKWTRTAA